MNWKNINKILLLRSDEGGRERGNKQYTTHLSVMTLNDPNLTENKGDIDYRTSFFLVELYKLFFLIMDKILYQIKFQSNILFY